MGVFTEQVQGLVSESKIKRQKQEQKEQQKARQEELKKQLYYLLDGHFTELSRTDYQEQYIRLTYFKNKAKIISKLTSDENEEYFLSTNYYSVLNSVYNSYKIVYNAIEKDIKEEEKQQKELKKQHKELLKLQEQQKNIYWQHKANEILNNGEHLQLVKQKNSKSKLLLIGAIPIAATWGFLQGALYPKKKKRR